MFRHFSILFMKGLNTVKWGVNLIIYTPKTYMEPYDYLSNYSQIWVLTSFFFKYFSQNLSQIHPNKMLDTPFRNVFVSSKPLSSKGILKYSINSFFIFANFQYQTNSLLQNLSVEMIKSYTLKRCLKLTRNKTIFKNFKLCWHSLFCWQWNVFENFEFSVWPCFSDNFYGLL